MNRVDICYCWPFFLLNSISLLLFGMSVSAVSARCCCCCCFLPDNKSIRLFRLRTVTNEIDVTTTNTKREFAYHINKQLLIDVTLNDVCDRVTITCLATNVNPVIPFR